MEFEKFEKILKEKAHKIGIELNSYQIEQYYKYMNLLIEWNEKVNLTAIIEPEDIILKHFIDSLTIAKYINENDKIADIGTGAGFPGLPLKILKPQNEIILIDSLNKRIKFLEKVIEENKLENISALHIRAEEIGHNELYRGGFDIVTSRAVAKLNVLLEYMLPLTKVGGKCICLNGPNIEQELEETKNANITMEKQVMSVVNLYKGILEVFSGLIIGYSAWLMLIGQLTFPIGVMFLVSSFMIYGQMETMGNGAFLLRVLDSSLNRMEKVMNIPVMDEGAKKIEPANCDIELKNVSFGYEPNQIIIKNFSALVQPGQKVAIVGPTGAGKTTIVNLLMKFYNVTSGDILIDDVSIKQLTRENVHDIFGMVLQDTWLFEGSVKENLAYGKSNISMDKIKEACQAAHIQHFIESMSHGYDTILDEDSNISQGQKQLFTIARAMIEDAPMLILDEATSSVDTRTEELIQDAMDRLTKGRTTFVIAHRLSTIKNADMILVMKDGDIIEKGTHDELMAQKGFYCNLYNSQFETFDEKSQS